LKTLNDLISSLKREQAEIMLTMAQGKPASWDAYQRLVGEYSGLQGALDILNNLLKEDNDDE